MFRLPNRTPNIYSQTLSVVHPRFAGSPFLSLNPTGMLKIGDNNHQLKTSLCLITVTINTEIYTSTN